MAPNFLPKKERAGLEKTLGLWHYPPKEPEETSMKAPYIILEVWHQNPDGSEGICGYVGIPEEHRWPLVADKQKARPHENSILADITTSQYLSHLRRTHPERVDTTSVRRVIRT